MLGLHLNLHKTEIFWPTVDERSRLEDVFPAEIAIPTEGDKLLGIPVSLNHQFCSDIILDRVNKTVHLMHAIQSLGDPRSELLLLHNCACISKLYFTMRTTAPMYLTLISSAMCDV